MTLIGLLFLLGIMFIAVEVIIPGGILGTIGGLLMFGGCVAAFSKFGTAGGVFAVVSAMAIATAALFLEFRVLPKTRMGRRAFLDREITGTSAPVGEEARELIGKTATAVTMLSPSGYILIDGQRHEAFCQSGQAPAGTSLLVTGSDNFRLIVQILPHT